MRSPSVLAILALLLDGKVGATILRGVVVENELSGPPLAKVQVDAVAGTNHTETGADGKFMLSFPKLQPGEMIRLIVSKSGYVVVNDVQLEQTLPANPDNKPLIVILCRGSSREEMARRFYRLKSFEAIEESYRNRLKQLEGASSDALAKLQEERDQARSAAEKAAEEFAKEKSSETLNRPGIAGGELI